MILWNNYLLVPLRRVNELHQIKCSWSTYLVIIMNHTTIAIVPDFDPNKPEQHKMPFSFGLCLLAHCFCFVWRPYLSNTSTPWKTSISCFHLLRCQNHISVISFCPWVITHQWTDCFGLWLQIYPISLLFLLCTFVYGWAYCWVHVTSVYVTKRTASLSNVFHCCPIIWTALSLSFLDEHVVCDAHYSSLALSLSVL